MIIESINELTLQYVDIVTKLLAKPGDSGN